MSTRYKGKEISTSFDYPPIPTRDADWSAILRGYDEGDPVGRGPTELAAIADLLQQIEEHEA
jgi:hypothetical protein